jgi:hypothetical protein
VALDAALWEQLEAHGVRVEHLETLLCLLALGKNGAWTWHMLHGQVAGAELRVAVGNRRAELVDLREGLLTDGRPWPCSGDGGVRAK